MSFFNTFTREFEKLAANPQVNGRLESINDKIMPGAGTGMAKDMLSGINPNLYQPSSVFNDNIDRTDFLPSNEPEPQVSKLNKPYGDPLSYNAPPQIPNLPKNLNPQDPNLIPPEIRKTMMFKLKNFDPQKKIQWADMAKVNANIKPSIPSVAKAPTQPNFTGTDFGFKPRTMSYPK